MAEVLEVEARLKDFITANLKTMEDNIAKFGASAGQNFGRATKGSSTFLSTMKGFIGAQAIMSGFNRAMGALKGVSAGVIGASADMEKFSVQFKVLLGSTEAARARLEEYADFAAKTPFELPGIVEAGRILQTFGGDMLATGDSLTMVGDMAAAAGVGFKDVATWVGRAYSSIQAGRPFGEAAQRLQEMGLLSAESRNKLEDLTAQGADSTVVWAEFQKTMEPFTGMMDEQSRTFLGLASTIRDNLDELMRDIGAGGIFDVLREILAEIVEFFSQNSERIEDFANMIGNVLGTAVKTLFVAFKSILPVFSSFDNSVEEARESSDTTSKAMEIMAKALLSLTFAVRMVWEAFSILEGFWKTIFSVAIDAIITGFKNILTTAKTLGAVIKAVFTGNFKDIPDIVKEGLAKAGKNSMKFVDDTKAAYTDFSISTVKNFDDIKNAWQVYREAMGNVTVATVENNAKQKESNADLTASTEEETKKQAFAWTKLHEKRFQAAQSLSGGLARIAAVNARQNKNLSVLAKGLAITDATIATFAAATKMLDPKFGGPPPLNFIAMAGVIATGLANVAQITAQTFARGTSFAPGGVALVGERGPELVNLPRGASVMPAEQTAQVNSNNRTVNFSPVITVQGDATPGAVRAIGDELEKTRANIEAIFRNKMVDPARLGLAAI